LIFTGERSGGLDTEP